MILSILSISLSIISLVAVVWSILCTIELKKKMDLLHYSLDLAHYNNMILSLGGSQVTAEQEFSINAIAQELNERAKHLNVNFLPFERPKGVDG